MSMGSLGLPGQYVLQRRGRLKEQFTSCHPALLLLHMQH